MSLLRSAATVSALTLLSRITGLIRDMLIARYFGVSAATDAFYVAFRIPNLLRRLFAEGCFTQAFVPMLSEVKETSSESALKQFISRVFTLLSTVVLLTTFLGVVAAPVVVWLIASGFHSDTETFDKAVLLTRVMFPYIFFMSTVAVLSGVLNLYRRFTVPAFTPVLLNLSFIVMTVFFYDYFDLPVMALAIAVMIGGLLQAGVQFIAIHRLGLMPNITRLSTAIKDAHVRRMLKLMVPAVVGVSVAPISIVINTNIASYLDKGAVTWLNYADRLMEFPTALLGVALGTVLLPSLSTAFNQGRLDTYNFLLDRGLRIVVLFALPASVGLVMLAEPLTAVLFQGKSFEAHDVHMTAIAMQGYGLGVISLVMLKILAPAFYARQDIRTPVRCAIASLITVQLTNLISVPLWGHAGLTVSVSMGALVNAFGLLWVLRRRGWYGPLDAWGRYVLQIVLGCIVMGLVLYYLEGQFDWAQMQSQWLRRILFVIGIIAVACVTYFVTIAVCGWRAVELRQALRKDKP